MSYEIFCLECQINGQKIIKLKINSDLIDFLSVNLALWEQMSCDIIIFELFIDYEKIFYDSKN